MLDPILKILIPHFLDKLTSEYAVAFEQSTHTHQWDPMGMNTQGPSSDLRLLANAYGIWLMVWQPTKLLVNIAYHPNSADDNQHILEKSHTKQRNIYREIGASYPRAPACQLGENPWTSITFRWRFHMGTCWFPACSLVCWRIIWVPKYPSIKRLYHKLQM